VRYAIPAVALIGLVCLALIPVPMVWGLGIAVVSLLLIAGIALARWLDAALLAVLRRHAAGRRGPTRAGTGIGRLGKGVAG
jgi:uncharacterized membrane protein YdfJ with MMPL/SSD domain